ncbi:MAG TPA: hypothetical protein PKN70_04180 [Smithellaceae bacterium]|nr:hypothetical protein [Smithellaceae bacterium]
MILSGTRPHGELSEIPRIGRLSGHGGFPRGKSAGCDQFIFAFILQTSRETDIRRLNSEGMRRPKTGKTEKRARLKNDQIIKITIDLYNSPPVGGLQ